MEFLHLIMLMLKPQLLPKGHCHDVTEFFSVFFYGGRCHQKYMNFKRFRQERDGSTVHYKIGQTLKKWYSQRTNCSSFFTGIGKCKTKHFSQNANRLATHIEVEHEIVKQSSQSANSLPFICNVEQSKWEWTTSRWSNNTL